MRDIVLIAHIILGLALIIIPILFLLEKKNSSYLKFLSTLSATISWLLLIPAGKLYLTFYPATKTLIKAGSKPWAHSILMETKEHWGLLLPIIATLAAGLVFMGKEKESKKWWILVMILSILLGVLGRIIKLAAYSS